LNVLEVENGSPTNLLWYGQDGREES